MKAHKEIRKRSDCPISYALDLLGDKWTLLILRDMLLSGKSAYNDFLYAEEGMATNILADRLHTLLSQGFIKKEISSVNKSKFVYSLTEKGISLLPVLVELSIWSAEQHPEEVNGELAKIFKKDKEKTIKEFTKVLKKKLV